MQGNLVSCYMIERLMEVKSLLLKIPYPGKEVVYGMLVATSTQLLIAVSP